MKPCDKCGEAGVVDGCCYDHAKVCKGIDCDEPTHYDNDLCVKCSERVV